MQFVHSGGRMVLRLIRQWLVMSLVPYAMYAVAYVFESRVPGRDVPVWRGQSKAFVPGDLALSLFMAAPGKSVRPVSFRRHVVGVVVGVAALIAVRRLTYKPTDYTPEAWRSPSKLYHDVAICMLFGWLGVTRVTPFYLSDWSQATARKILGLLGLAVWMGGLVWDETHDEVPNSRQHPTHYRPIWSAA